MTKSLLFFLLLSTLALLNWPAQAEMGNTYQTASAAVQTPPNTPGRKLGNAISNLTLGFLEIPKNIIITNNEINTPIALTGGTLKGVFHMFARAFVGFADLITFPVQTEPLTTPEFVWQRFDVETRYNPLMQMQK